MLNAADLERLGQFERYKDVDGDGVCYRTIPGTENPLAAYFTRGTGHNEKSGYSERPEDWKKNLDRLARKLETARGKIPAPVIRGDSAARIGLIAYGSSDPAMTEAIDLLREQGISTEYCRLRVLPISNDVLAFVARHQRVYVIEQNRDGQVAALLRSTIGGALADRLVSIGHYNGTPLAAENIVRPILGWEQNPSGPGWPTGIVEVDNPETPHAHDLSPE